MRCYFRTLRVLFPLPFSTWSSPAHSSDYPVILAQNPNSKYIVSIPLWFVGGKAVNGLYMIALSIVPALPHCVGFSAFAC